jgi:Ribonuclease E/G family
MKRELLWDAGPGEIRAGIVEDNALVEFRIIRLRRNESMVQSAGERYTARIVSHTGNGQVMVDLGAGHMAMLRNCPAVSDGSLIEVEMVRGPYPEPGNWKLPVVKPLADYAPLQAEAAWHFSAEPWELFLRATAPKVSTIICRDVSVAGDVRRVLGDQAPDIQIKPETIQEADFDSLIVSAVSGCVPLPNGMLMIERTRAMTMIDIDGNVDALKLNMDAAAEIPRLLRLFDITGAIGIDFVSVESKEARQQILAAFDDAAGILGPHERTAINGFGFCQIVRRRTGPSLPEIICGTRRAQMSDESSAISLLRDAGRSIGVGPRQLVARSAIIDLIKSWPEETGALRSSLGVDIVLLPDDNAKGYGHVHVAQR